MTTRNERKRFLVVSIIKRCSAVVGSELLRPTRDRMDPSEIFEWMR